jgi:hypothetical protein
MGGDIELTEREENLRDAMKDDNAFDGPPQRIRLSRKKGWRIPANTVVVSRPGRWGNPYVVGTPENGGNITPTMAVMQYEKALRAGRLTRQIADLTELRGKNLACWCSLTAPCHADVLLRLANTP